MPTTKPDSPTPLRVKLTMAILSPIVFFALVEVVLAVSGVHVPRYEWNERNAPAYWVPAQLEGKPPGFVRAFPRLSVHFPEPQPNFVRDKPKNGFRLFTLGESTVHGMPLLIGSFTDWLRERLTAMMPNRLVEVINGGHRGWHAEQVVNFLEECLEHDPDVIYWMVGHNEYSPNNLLKLQEVVHHPFTGWLRRSAMKLRITQVMRYWIPSVAQPVAAPDQLSLQDRPCFGSELPLLKERFREHTARAIRLCKEAGVPLVMGTMQRNVRDFPPTGSAFSPDVLRAPERKKKFEDLYGEAYRLLEPNSDAAIAGPARTRRALTLLLEAEKIDARPAKLHFAKGRAHELMGQQDEARAAYLLSLELDSCPSRAQEWVQRTIRELAAQEGVVLVDFERIFDEAAPRLKLTGSELILDNVHPTFDGHEMMARKIIEAIEKQVGVPLDHSKDVPSKEVRDRIGITGYGQFMADRANNLHNAKLVVQSGVANELWTRTHRFLDDFVEKYPADYEARMMLGCLQAIAGEAARAKANMEMAIREDTAVRINFLRFQRAMLPFQRVFAAAGLDVAAWEASLTPRERESVEGRMDAVENQ